MLLVEGAHCRIKMKAQYVWGLECIGACVHVCVSVCVNVCVCTCDMCVCVNVHVYMCV